MSGAAARRLQAAGALVVLLAVIVGVPALLLSMGLVPHGMPSVDQIVTVVTSRDDGRLAEVVLAAGVWVCWALFTASTAAEIVALARSRPAGRLPGLGVFQRPAAALVTAVAVGFTVAPMAVAGASASNPPPLPAMPVATAGTVLPASAQGSLAVPVRQGPADPGPAAGNQPPAAQTATTYVVQRRDTLWAIAERYLGDPLRYPEIIRLNPTAVGPDNEILPGTALILPSDVTGLPPTNATSSGAPSSTASGTGSGTAGSGRDVTVLPGDTLWNLTEQVTGNGADWPQAWAASRGRTEPAGDRFTDPSLIRPGWTLTIPTLDASTPPADVPPPAPPPGSPPAASEPAPTSTPPTSTPPTSTPPTSTPPTSTPPASESSATAPPTSAGAGEPGQTASASTTASTPAATTFATAGPTSDQPSGARPEQATNDAVPDLPLVAFTGGGLLLAGLSLTALLGYRRRQFRHRRPGRTISDTPPELLRVERAVHAAGGTAMPDVTWLDRALRGLAQTLRTVEGAGLPEVIAARLTDDALTLVLTEPFLGAPTPWTVDADGTRWSIRRGDPLPYVADRRAYTFAPYPTLASVGATADGEHWLLDLERAGTVSLTGDPERCADLARFLAAELAHNTWSEMLQVTLVGFGKELTAINPDRLTYTDDVDRLITALGAHCDAVTDAVQASGVDVLTGRLHDIAGDVWAPHVVLLAAHAADKAALTRLRAAISQRPTRGALALVVVNDPDPDLDRTPADAAGCRLTVDATGALHITALGVELVAAQLPAEEAGQLARMLALAAVTDDQPIPPARGDQLWEAHADVCGGLRLDSGQESSAPDSALPAASPGGTRIEQPAGTSTSSGDSVLPLPPQTYLDRAATTADDLAALAPATDDGIRSRVEAADPTLDADLTDWADPSCPRPKLTLLGPVEVRAHGRLPDHNPRRRFYTEIVAYLATRPTGATSEQFATALWPAEPDILGKTKVRQALSAVRTWLGSDPATGADYLPSGLSTAGPARYRIQHILIDAELFRRLRLRGQARGADGIADLHAALRLVTGKPFDVPAPRRGAPGGYGWLIEDNHRLDHDYAAMIVDVAHTVATHHLAASEPDLAAAAAQVALAAGSFEDVPLLDLVAACDAQNKRAEADAYVARILANHDAEVEEDLPPRTAEILYRRHWPDRSS